MPAASGLVLVRVSNSEDQIKHSQDEIDWQQNAKQVSNDGAYTRLCKEPVAAEWSA